jgi:CHAT domain-containing protein
MPETPRQSELRAARTEARYLQREIPGSLLLSGPEATSTRILAELSTFPWAHFACHAESRADDPSQGCLLTHDYERHPLTILNISRARPEVAELAFLSACSTARSSLKLADEAISLAASFLLAGYPNVIGTLWPVWDGVAAEISTSFYERIGELAASQRPYRFATALHEAITLIRDTYEDIPYLWAAHVHFGA